MHSSLVILFWTCIAGVAYAYGAYPPLIYVLSRVFGRAESTRDLADHELPTVSLLIAAHNERDVIEQRIHNALAMDYPPGKLEIVVASDGSTDETTDIVNRFPGRVWLLDFPHRQGKAATLNAAIPQLNGQIVLLSDANTSIDLQAMRQLARWFVDPTVGVVCGRLVLVDPAGGRNADSLYWRYETFLKSCESRLGALLGSNGAIYAIRRESFVPIPPETIVDDFVAPLLAKLRSNCRIVYDTEAIGSEETAPHVREEFRRRVRIGAGGFQAIGMLWPLLNPRRGWGAFTFASHKIMRWVSPFLLIGALLCGFAVGHGAVLAQMACYGIALVVALVPPKVRILKPLRLTTMFAMMNAALLLGFVRWMRGVQKPTWKPTARTTYVALRQAA